MIPKILHFIWIGPAPIPEEFQSYKQSWERLHPHWDIKLWDDEHIKTLSMQHRAFYDSDHIIVRKTDVLRYELLYQFGGLYVDFDVECLKNVDPLFPENGPGMVVGMEDAQWACTAVMASVPGHPSVKRLMDNLPAEVTPKYHTGQTGPVYLTKHVLHDPAVQKLPPFVFYPYCWNQKHLKDASFPHSYAVHHWAHTWKDDSE